MPLFIQSIWVHGVQYKILHVNTYCLYFEAEFLPSLWLQMSFLHRVTWSSNSTPFSPLMWTFSVFSSDQDFTCLQMFAQSTKIQQSRVWCTIAIVFYSQPIDRFIAGEKIQGKQNEVISFITKLFQVLFVSPQSNFPSFSHIQYWCFCSLEKLQ